MDASLKEVYDRRIEEKNKRLKLEIVRENFNLTPNDIKKELRKQFPDTYNEEVKELIIEVMNEKMKIRVKNRKKREEDCER